MEYLKILIEAYLKSVKVIDEAELIRKELRVDIAANYGLVMTDEMGKNPQLVRTRLAQLPLVPDNYNKPLDKMLINDDVHLDPEGIYHRIVKVGTNYVYQYAYTDVNDGGYEYDVVYTSAEYSTRAQATQELHMAILSGNAYLRIILGVIGIEI